VGQQGGIQIDYGALRTRAFNNTIYANLYGVYIGNESECASVRNNVVFQNDEGAITDEGTGTVRDHNFSNDHGFVDAAALDFHVLPSSPAVDRGATIPRIRRDLDGIVRPQCTRFDIGAYEFDGCPSPRLI
jgi:hypothetical protein